MKRRKLLLANQYLFFWLAAYIRVYLCGGRNSGAFQILIQNLINKKNLHLTISAIILTIVSLVYGLSPNNILPKFFDIEVESIDLKHTFRATMGLYFGMIVLWIIGIFRPRQWRTATMSNVFFMIGLAFGRTVSLFLDGIP